MDEDDPGPDDRETVAAVAAAVAAGFVARVAPTIGVAGCLFIGVNDTATIPTSASRAALIAFHSGSIGLRALPPPPLGAIVADVNLGGKTPTIASFLPQERRRRSLCGRRSSR